MNDDYEVTHFTHTYISIYIYISISTCLFKSHIKHLVLQLTVKFPRPQRHQRLSMMDPSLDVFVGLSATKGWYLNKCITVELNGGAQVCRSWFFKWMLSHTFLVFCLSFSESRLFLCVISSFKCSWHMLFVCECLPRLLINSSIARKYLAFSKFGRLPSWQPPIVRCFRCWFPPLPISGSVYWRKKCFHGQVHMQWTSNHRHFVVFQLAGGFVVLHPSMSKKLVSKTPPFSTFGWPTNHQIPKTIRSPTFGGSSHQFSGEISDIIPISSQFVIQVPMDFGSHNSI